MTIDVATFSQRLPLYSLRDSIEIEQKFRINFYKKKAEKMKKINRPVASIGSICGKFAHHVANF
jgi:hypothetical protein